MTDQELDTLMRRVLLDSLKLDAESAASGELAFEPTPRYQRQMAAMVKDPLKWERRRARPLWKNVAQKAAVILLVFSLSLGSLMAVSPTVRAAVVRWVTEWYETHIVYRYSGEQITGEMPQYEISGLPQDYTEIIRDVYEASVSVVYESPSGDMICFDYTHMQQGAANIIAPGDDEILDVIDYVVSMIYYASPTSLLVVSTHCYPDNSISPYQSQPSAGVSELLWAAFSLQRTSHVLRRLSCEHCRFVL